jgi:hypothetical protein
MKDFSIGSGLYNDKAWHAPPYHRDTTLATRVLRRSLGYCIIYEFGVAARGDSVRWNTEAHVGW